MSDYIIPTKKNPVYSANNGFGPIEIRFYKDFQVEDKTGNCYTIGATIGTSYSGAVQALHEWLESNIDWYKDENQGVSLFEIDGSHDKWGDVKWTKVYHLSASQVRKFFARKG